MNGVTSILQLVAAACLGVYAGAMLTEGMVLVTWWQSIAAPEFLAWYAANDERLIAFFQPLTSLTAVASLLAAIASFRAGHPARWLSAAACALTLVAVATYFVYFEAANASFSAATIAVDAVPAELARWGTWHHSRTALSVIAFACALLALRRRDEASS